MKPSWDDAPPWAQFLVFLPNTYTGDGDWEWHENRPKMKINGESLFRRIEWNSDGRKLKALPRSGVFIQPEPRP